jgi:hypothetical protein
MENDIEKSEPSLEPMLPEKAQPGLSEQDRREALKRFGKYVAYAAPALLAMTSQSKAFNCSRCR